MKKKLFAMLAGLCLAVSLDACSIISARQKYGSVEEWKPYLAQPQIRIVRVERSTTGDKFGEVALLDGSRTSFKDNLVKVDLLPQDDEIAFMLENKTSHSAKLIWDETVYIDGNGQSGRVIHGGVRLVDKDASSPPAVIPKGSKLTESITPSSHVYYSQSIGWSTNPLPKLSGKSFITLVERDLYVDAYEKSPQKAEMYKVLLPIEIEGVKHEYTVTFGVTTFGRNTNDFLIEKLDFWRQTAKDEHAKAMEKLAANELGLAMDFAWNAAALFPSSIEFQKTKSEAFTKGGQCSEAIVANSTLCGLGVTEYCSKTCP